MGQASSKRRTCRLWRIGCEGATDFGSARNSCLLDSHWPSQKCTAASIYSVGECACHLHWVKGTRHSCI
jgi:hypothetical protein